MDAHHSGAAQQAVQGTDVAEADEPFGRGGQFSKRNVVDKLYGAVAATVADNGLDARVIECPEDVAGALVDGTGILPVDYLTHIGADDGHQTPRPQHVGGSLDVLHRGVIGRRDKRHRVAVTQIGRFLAVEHQVTVGNGFRTDLFLSARREDQRRNRQQ